MRKKKSITGGLKSRSSSVHRRLNNYTENKIPVTHKTRTITAKERS